MLKYILKRLLTSILLSVGAISIAFMVLYLLGYPSPPTGQAMDLTPEGINAWRETRGLNDPLLIQYVRYMAGVFRGDFGTSFRNDAPITREVTARFLHTLHLSFVTLLFSLLLAVPVGIIAAIKRNTWVDKMSMLIALIGISIPVFLLGWLLAPLWLGLGLSRLWPSAITLGTAMLSAMIYSTRSSVLEAMEQNYIRAAKAKGLSGGKIIRKHILPNIVIPMLASFKANLGVFFTGIFIVESFFGWPGIGFLMRMGISANDFPVVLGSLLMFILFFAFINFAVDIAKAFADPVMRRGRLC